MFRPQVSAGNQTLILHHCLPTSELLAREVRKRYEDKKQSLYQSDSDQKLFILCFDGVEMLGIKPSHLEMSSTSTCRKDRGCLVDNKHGVRGAPHRGRRLLPSVFGMFPNHNLMENNQNITVDVWQNISQFSHPTHPGNTPQRPQGAHGCPHGGRRSVPGVIGCFPTIICSASLLDMVFKRSRVYFSVFSPWTAWWHSLQNPRRSFPRGWGMFPHHDDQLYFVMVSRWGTTRYHFKGMWYTFCSIFLSTITAVRSLRTSRELWAGVGVQEWQGVVKTGDLKTRMFMMFFYFYNPMLNALRDRQAFSLWNCKKMSISELGLQIKNNRTP